MTRDLRILCPNHEISIFLHFLINDYCKFLVQAHQHFCCNEDDSLGVILDDDIETKTKELNELQEMLKNLFLNILHVSLQLT